MLNKTKSCEDKIYELFNNSENTMLFVDIENIGSKKSINTINEYLDIYNCKFKKILTSTHSLNFIKRYEPTLKKWGKSYLYNQSKKIINGADLSILNMLRKSVISDKRCVLFSNDNLLIKEFISICKQNKCFYLILSTNKLRPKYIIQNNLIKRSIII